MRRFVVEREIPRVGAIAAAFARGSLNCGDMLLLWLERMRQRRALASLSDHMLRDLGLSRTEVDLESAKRFWED